MEKIDVIFPVYNNAKLANVCLKHLMGGYNWMGVGGVKPRIIVVDDASTEDVSFLQNKDIVLLKHKFNTGIARALNDASELIESEWFIWIESDTLVTLKEIIMAIDRRNELLKKHPKLAWLGFKSLQPNGEMQFFYRNMDKFGNSVNMPSSSDPDAEENNGIRIVDAPANPFYLMRKEALKDIGGADNNLKRQWIDADLGMKLKQTDWIAIADGSMEFFHLNPKKHLNEQDVKDHDYFKSKWRRFAENRDSNTIA